jgi:hypothetical protein
MTLRRTTAAAVLALLAAAPAACGNSAPTKQQFLAKADPVCKQGSDLAGILSAPSNLSAIGDVSKKLAETTTKTVAALNKLKFPSGADGRAAHDMVGAMRDAAAKARAVAPPVASEDLPAVETAAKAEVDAYKAANDKARNLGSTQCARGEGDAASKLGTALGPTLKGALILKADAICTKAKADVFAVAKPKSDADARRYLDETLPIAQKAHDEVKALPAPAFDKDKLDAMMTAWDELLRLSNDANAAVHANDDRRFLSTTEQLADQAVQLSGKASAYGFQSCGTS